MRLVRREDSKVPCPCGSEPHARFNFQKINNNLRRKVHPAADELGSLDIKFQRSAPPRPSENVVDQNVEAPEPSTIFDFQPEQFLTPALEGFSFNNDPIHIHIVYI